MAYEDYSEEELKNIIDELLNIHISKLMMWEIAALNNFNVLDRNLENRERDWLIGIYDRIGESGY